MRAGSKHDAGSHAKHSGAGTGPCYKTPSRKASLGPSRRAFSLRCPSGSPCSQHFVACSWQEARRLQTRPWRCVVTALKPNPNGKACLKPVVITHASCYPSPPVEFLLW